MAEPGVPASTTNTTAANNMDFMLIASTSIKGLLASATIVGGSHILRRSPFHQRRSMRRTLAATQRQLAASAVYKAHAHGPFPRTSSVRRLKDWLASPPRGPIVVTGAEGTGTSSVAGAALAQGGATLLLRLNLRENPPGVGKRPFMRALMTNSGYFTRMREAVDIKLLKEDNDAGLEYDVTTFLSRLTEVFQAEKVARDRMAFHESLWRWSGLPSIERPLPVVFIDEVHTHPSLNHTDSDFVTFLRWAQFCTDSQLAHVLLVARPEQVISIENGSPEFHAMRQRLVINFPPLDQVRSYLISEANGELSNELIDRIVSNIGGQLKSLRLFTHTMQRIRSYGSSEQQQKQHPSTPQHSNGRVSEACEMLLEDLIADSKELVLRTWDRLVSDGNTAASYKRALRFWKIAKVIANHEAMPRQEMVNQVFGPGPGVSASEIEEYIAAGLLTYCCPPNEQEEEGNEGRSIPHSNPPASGELWLSAASPLLRGAFSYLTNTDSGISRSKVVELELAKLELLKRDSQLNRRRTEQSAQTQASATLLKEVSQLGAKEVEHLGNMISMLGVESHETLSELRSVRHEYDKLKWKNRWW